MHRESEGSYGGPGITAELREAGERVNHKRIVRLMRGAGLPGVRLRRRHRTTIADPAAAKTADLIGRDFRWAEKAWWTSAVSAGLLWSGVVTGAWWFAEWTQVGRLGAGAADAGVRNRRKAGRRSSADRAPVALPGCRSVPHRAHHRTRR